MTCTRQVIKYWTVPFINSAVEHSTASIAQLLSHCLVSDGFINGRGHERLHRVEKVTVEECMGFTLGHVAGFLVQKEWMNPLSGHIKVHDISWSMYCEKFTISKIFVSNLFNDEKI